MKDPLITFTPDTIPEPKAAISLQAKAAFMTAAADIEGEAFTPENTPIIGKVEVSVAKQSLENALGFAMANPHAVLLKYSDLLSTSAHIPEVPEPQPAETTLEDVTGVPTPTTPEHPADDEEPDMSITGMLDTIRATPSLPLAIVGDAGTGKTSIIRKWASDNGYELNLFLANTASEDDVAGAITPDHDNKMAVAYPLEKLHRSTTHKTVLFLDELNTARREVQDPLLTLIQDRCLPNGTPLHPETVIVTAINPSATYNNHEMSPQLRNRFMWYYHNPSEYDWLQWMTSTDLGDSPAGRHIEAMVLDGTLKFDKDDAFTQERNEFTTPRSLYNLLKVSRGSITRLKALAENLVAPATAEAIRLHGYNDKDTRGNSFFEERKKVNPDTMVEKEVVFDEALMAKVKAEDIFTGGLGLNTKIKEALDTMGKVYTQSNPVSENALGGSTTSQADESSLLADIQSRLSKFEG